MLRPRKDRSVSGSLSSSREAWVTMEVGHGRKLSDRYDRHGTLGLRHDNCVRCVRCTMMMGGNCEGWLHRWAVLLRSFASLFLYFAISCSPKTR